MQLERAWPKLGWDISWWNVCKAARRTVPYRKMAVIGFGILAGCNSSNFADASPETQMLRTDVVPRLIEWSRGNSPSFPIGSLLTQNGYRHVCIVREYRSLSAIEPSAGPIVRYHTDFGAHIDEAHAAMVVVKGGVAHAVLVPDRNIFLGANENTPCYRIDGARFERQALEGYRTPIATLVGVE